jgi:uncharacterized protein YbbC (DUF1343 family)
VFVHVIDRAVFRPLRTGLHAIAAVKALWPDAFAWRRSSWEGRPPHFDLLIGNNWVREQLDAGQPVGDIVARWQATLAAFDQQRQQVFMYE